ncbi:MAG: hypothetical protein NVSMB25_00220 [Thermoleophilaceae bacterium]
MSEGAQAYAIKGESVTVTGVIRPLVLGEIISVDLMQGGRLVSTTRIRVRKARVAGSWSAILRPRRAGSYTVRARHDASPAQASATSKPVRLASIVGDAREGVGGVRVRLLQRALAGLGYVTSRGGRYDSATARAVLAFRKVNRMGLRTTADTRIFAMLFRGQGGFRLRYPGGGRHVEFDFSRQVLVLADHGRAERIYHASSGKPSTPTVFGTYSFYTQEPGTNRKGMFDSSYFTGGYAIHGYPAVPAYPASHGCIRIPLADAVSVYNSIRLGEHIFVYR